MFSEEMSLVLIRLWFRVTSISSALTFAIPSPLLARVFTPTKVIGISLYFTSVIGSLLYTTKVHAPIDTIRARMILRTLWLFSLILIASPQNSHKEVLIVVSGREIDIKQHLLKSLEIQEPSEGPVACD